MSSTSLAETRGANTKDGAVGRAIERAIDAVVRRQQDDGSWTSIGDVGPSSTAQATVALAWTRRLGDSDAVRAAEWLAAEQRPDGGWVRYPHATSSDLDATAAAWAALHLTGSTKQAAACEAARLFVEERGGVSAVLRGLERGDLGALFLAMAGLVDPARLPVPPLELALVKPAERWILRRVHGGVVMVTYALGAIVRRLKSPEKQIGRRLRDAALDAFEPFQNDNGSFNDFTPATALALAATHALGGDRGARLADRAATWIRSHAETTGSVLWFPSQRLPVWCTTWNTRALLHAGMPVRDAVVDRAARWLLAAKPKGSQAAINNPRLGAPRVGGWAFTPTNDTMPDCDDTGAVLSVLGDIDRARRASGLRSDDEELRAAARDAIAWLDGMQNDDGGWASYTQGLPPKPPGPAMTRPVNISSHDPRSWLRLLRGPPLGLGDPSTEDVTARVLHGLGAWGGAANDRRVARGIAFLRAQQCTSGAWWGRWMTNFLAGTSFGLLGLESVGADLRAPWVRRATQWLETRQNADGSWGETVASYVDPDLAGIGPGSPALTGLVVCALSVSSDPGSAVIRRAITYLLERQSSEGTWSAHGYVVPLVPPDTFYAHPDAATYFALEALARTTHRSAR